MSVFWTVWISILLLGSIVGCYVLLKLAQKGQSGEDENVKTGHQYDGIEEFDNPLPKWWVWMFIGTIVFGLVYSVLYPALGSFQGFLGWSSQGQWEQEVASKEHEYAAIFNKYAAVSVKELANNPEALKTGQRLFANNCAVCHGSTATGSRGFPNLADKDWLYGGDAETIKQSIMNGRFSNMPPWGSVLGEEGVANVTQFVLSLSGQSHDAAATEKGQTSFKQFCISCHGAEGKGNVLFGAPNLTDNVWLYGGAKEYIAESIGLGRKGVMPAHKDLLGDEKVHVIAAYVYSLSQ